jgi:hypothetical protein
VELKYLGTATRASQFGRNRLSTPLAAVVSPRMGRKPAHWTRVDRGYERIRIDMQKAVH